MSFNFIDLQKWICKDKFADEYAFMIDIFYIDLLA